MPARAETLVLACEDCGENFLAYSINAKRCPSCRPYRPLWLLDDPIGAYQERRFERRHTAALRRLQQARGNDG